jgi:dimethylglycine dehydrogenase
MDEYYKYCGTANTIGVPFRVISPAEVKELWPLVNLGDGADTPKIVGALYHPDDGHIAPVDLTMALRRGAPQLRRGDLRADRSAWRHAHAVGRMEARDECGRRDVRARRLRHRQLRARDGRNFGLSIPAIPVEHQYIVYDESEELKAYRKAGGRELAVLRESDASYYLREERLGWILGPYEKGAPARFADGVPPTFGKELFPGDLDRLLPHVEAAMKRVPCLEHCGIKTIVNGSDLLHARRQPHDRSCSGGCATSGSTKDTASGSRQPAAPAGSSRNGSSRVSPGIDMLAVDPRRFGGYAGKRYTVKKTRRPYRNVFTIHYPDEEREDARPAKTSAVYEKAESDGRRLGAALRLGARELVCAGGRRAQGQVELPAQQLFRARRQRVPADAREGRNNRPDPFTKHEVRGPGAEAWLDSLVANKVPTKQGPDRAVPRADEAWRHPHRVHDHAACRRALLRRERGRGRALRRRLPAADAA